ncbi:MAG: nuclear transport factor 2 family protein [Bacteroidetes bacterium]|nr:nuclear transport factor 2 family protein [Bacteroidota bacterium]
MAQNHQEVDQLLTDWHNAAAVGNQDEYFNYLDDNSIYIGTDSTEIWTKDAFYEWATPHFEKEKTWTFVATHRDIYFSDDGLVAWFDELVDYGSGTLRGSGVLQKRGNEWKIMQYVLSLPVPNDKYKAVMDVILKKE